MSLSDIEKVVTSHLRDCYIDKGYVNFYFKSNRLQLPFDNRVIGRVLKHGLASKGLIELWSTERSNRVSVWKTCFNGGNI